MSWDKGTKKRTFLNLAESDSGRIPGGKLVGTNTRHHDVGKGSGDFLRLANRNEIVESRSIDLANDVVDSADGLVVTHKVGGLEKVLNVRVERLIVIQGASNAIVERSLWKSRDFRRSLD